jgi:hypothetical protein
MDTFHRAAKAEGRGPEALEALLTETLTSSEENWRWLADQLRSRLT